MAHEGAERKEEAMTFLEKNLSGHITVRILGLTITIFGFNAMRGAWEISGVNWGYLVIAPPFYYAGRWNKWKIYYSPNATPWAATFAIGPGLDEKTKLLARVHAYKFGNKLQPYEAYEKIADAVGRAF